jgi:hypothetical protein
MKIRFCPFLKATDIHCHLAELIIAPPEPLWLSFSGFLTGLPSYMALPTYFTLLLLQTLPFPPMQSAFDGCKQVHAIELFIHKTKKGKT